MISINNTTKEKINLARTKRIAASFLRAYHKSGYEVSLAVIGAAKMKKLNRQYRGIDKTTDVLSFGPPASRQSSALAPSSRQSSALSPAKSFPGGKYLGEVVINPAALKNPTVYEAIIGRQAPEAIFYFVLVHGLLHLIGRRDDREPDRQKMLAEGKRFLAKIYKKFP